MCDDFEKFNQTIDRLIVEIDNLLKNASVDTDTIDHLTKYLIILMSGYIENFFKQAIKDCLEKKSIPQGIMNFIIENTKDITNLKYDKLKGILGKFNIECDSIIT